MEVVVARNGRKRRTEDFHKRLDAALRNRPEVTKFVLGQLARGNKLGKLRLEVHLNVGVLLVVLQQNVVGRRVLFY